MQPENLPQMHFVESTVCPYIPEIRVPEDYYGIASRLPKEKILSALEAKAKDIERQMGLKMGMEWDDSKGLCCINVQPDCTSKMLLEGNLYTPHNVDTPQKAIAFFAIALEYLRWVAYFSKKI